jgi:hypothetical protein
MCLELSNFLADFNTRRAAGNDANAERIRCCTIYVSAYGMGFLGYTETRDDSFKCA